MDSTKILMVCLGNICRSPTAEGVLRVKLQRAGLDRVVAVDSAGTHSERGARPDARAQAAAARRGYDLSALRSRRIVAADFERFDLMLAMDRDNLDFLRRLQPATSRARVELLLRAASAGGEALEVPDPYYGAAGGFDRVLDLIEAACDELVGRLVAVHLGGSGGNLD